MGFFWWFIYLFMYLLQKIGKISELSLQAACYTFILGLLQDSLQLCSVNRIAAGLGDGLAPGHILTAIRLA